MRKFTLGHLATIEDILEFGPKGMELSFNTGTKIKYDLDFYNYSPENHKNYANTYFTSHFPRVSFIPGFILEYPTGRKEVLMGGWYKVIYQKITKLPTTHLLKRRQL